MGHDSDTKFFIPIEPDEDGFTGRECPNEECKKYFKVQFGTGLKGEFPCVCPYCGHCAGHDQFFTQEQIDYAYSVGINKVMHRLEPEFKKLERTIGTGLFKIKMTVDTRGLHSPVKQYYERELETVVICEQCTLRYAIYGLYGYCPDCGVHNSLQIFQTNLAVVQKYIDLAESSEPTMAEKLLGDALENLVSEFQSFGKVTLDVIRKQREVKDSANLPGFQNLEHARKWFQSEWSVDISSGLTPEDWTAVLRCFQKRHVLAHCAGVADADYVGRAHDPYAVVGRKIRVEEDEVVQLIELLDTIARNIAKAATAEL